MFIEEADYKAVIRDQILAIVQQQPDTRAVAEVAAQSEAESYLRGRYDTAQIFSKTGAQRHPFLVMLMVDIALYHLHARITPNAIPDIRMDRYDAAITWLKGVAKGELSPDLPVRVTDSGQSATLFSVQSQPRKSWLI